VAQGARVSGLSRDGGRLFWSASAALALMMAAGPTLAAPALPTGGQVTAGAANIGAVSGSSLTVTQASDRAIIDWQGFSVGEGGAVRFENGSGATLNRVTGSSVSALDGLLSASGSVYLINPNGVIVGPSGEVQVGGTFAASTLDLSDSAFLAGGPLTFSGSSAASVINYGRIGALGGDVALIAARVENHGAIDAPGGDVGLAAGYRVVLRDAILDDGRFQVLAGGADTSATNDGSIAAAEAELRANGGNVYALAGNTGSVIKAAGVATNDGKVFLVAEGGSTTAAGQIEATGQVETSGSSVDFTGLRVAAPNWLVDPYDLTVDAAAASTISANLATTSVTLKTTAVGATGPGVQNPAGLGDIDVAAPISWASANTLTLDAYHSISITAPITVSGPGKVALITNDGGTGGDYGFGLTESGFQGSIAFTGAANNGQGLKVNGQAYVLLFSLTDVAGISNAPGGDDALAKSLNAAGTTYTNAVVANFIFAGAFTGLGNTISNLTINAPSAGPVGLFAETTGVVRDIGLVGGAVTGLSDVGDLVGYEKGGSILDAYASGSVSGSGSSSANLGGLVGYSTGSIANAFATGAVTGPGGSSVIGGLVGYTNGSVTGAEADGAVNGGAGSFAIGGLAGEADVKASITGSDATGDVSAGTGSFDLGGLVGYNLGQITDAGGLGSVTGGSAVGGLAGYNNGTISESDAAVGTIRGTNNIGGFVGYNDVQGTVSSSSSSLASVSGTNSVGGLIGDNLGTVNSESFSSDATTGTQFVGGLAGYNDGSISDSIATGGAVTGSGMTVQYVGGLVGYNDTLGSITSSASGEATVTATSGADVGGLVGVNLGAISEDSSTDTTFAVGGSATGGLVGFNTAVGTIADSIATGATGGAADVGGLVGYNLGEVSTSTGWGEVSGSSSVGGLAGYNNGSIVDSEAGFGDVAGTNLVGGLVGFNDIKGTISGAETTGASVTGAQGVGGLVGQNLGGVSLTSSWDAAGGTSYVGGLVGYNDGSISNSNAELGAVKGFGTGATYIGGLAGYNDSSGTISSANSSAATVLAGSGVAVGGLVGLNAGQIDQSFSTDIEVAGSSGTATGGLVGYNHTTGTITDTYASGPVAGGADVGGLVGENLGQVATSWSSGAISGVSSLGGLVGANASSGAIKDGYFDADTSGEGLGLQSDGSTGLTTSQLQTALPAGFNAGVWAPGPGIYPYLTIFFPDGVQVIRGTADGGVGDAVSGAMVEVFADGALLAGGPQTSLSDGSFYALAPSGTLTASSKIGETVTLGGASAVSGLTYTDQPVLTSGNLLNFNVRSGTVSEITGEASLSLLSADVASTFGAEYPVVTDQIASPIQTIRATNATGFSVNSALAVSGLTLDSFRSLTFTSAVTVGGAGQVVLTTNDGGTGGTLGFGLGASGFSGGLAFTGAPNSGQGLSINGQAYTLLFSAADVAGIGGTGFYALAAPLDASGSTYSAAVVGGIFNGTFNGLGNAISNLSISAPSTTGVGLFHAIGASGVVSNLAVTSASVSGGSDVGALTGDNAGLVQASFSSGAVSGSNWRDTTRAISRPTSRRRRRAATPGSAAWRAATPERSTPRPRPPVR